MEKDDAEKIYAKSYNYFKKTLENKFNESFTKYSDNEFEEMILQSQKKKFG